MGFGYGHTVAHTGAVAVAKVSGRKVRKVFLNSQVAHVWAQQSQSFGKSSNGNFYFEGATIYSYGAHFPIASFTDIEVDGRRIVLMTSKGCSVTTSGHVADVRSALRGLDSVLVVTVPDLKDWHESMRPVSLWSVGDDAARKAAVEAERQGKAHNAVRQSFIASVAMWEGYASKSDDFGGRVYRNKAADARAAWEAYRAAFKLGRKFKLPADCAAVVAAEKAAEAKAKDDERKGDARDFAKRLDARKPLCGFMRADYATPPAVADACLYRVADSIRSLEYGLKQANTARHWLNRGKASAELRGRVSKLIRDLRGSVAAWEGVRAERQAMEHRGRMQATVDALRSHIRGESPLPADWEASRGCIIEVQAENLVRDIARAGIEAADVVAWIWRRVSICLYQSREIGWGRTPEWRRNRGGDRRTHAERAAAWIAGESIPGFHSESPTLVRRRGEQLETSRGAFAPFRDAVAVFVKAQACRAAGKHWQSNGETMRAGAFSLNRIDCEGNITIGCHRITFDEMQRLAIKEVPTLVRARFPLPALI